MGSLNLYLPRKIRWKFVSTFIILVLATGIVLFQSSRLADLDQQANGEIVLRQTTKKHLGNHHELTTVSAGFLELTAENLRYGVDTLTSQHLSIEGNLWEPLPDYRNPCWVEKLVADSAQINESEEQGQGHPLGVGHLNRSTKQPRKHRFLLADQLVTVRGNSLTNNDVLIQQQVRQEQGTRQIFRQTLDQRGKVGQPWLMRCLPYAYLIGVTKSGTTDFLQHLTLHPHVLSGLSKEIHYWNIKRFPEPAYLYVRPEKEHLTFDNYVDLFSVAADIINTSVVNRPNQNSWHPKIIVDGSVSLFWEDTAWTQIPGNKGLDVPVYTTAGTLAYFQPKAKLILLLRDPVERLYSYFCKFAVIDQSLTQRELASQRARDKAGKEHRGGSLLTHPQSFNQRGQKRSGNDHRRGSLLPYPQDFHQKAQRAVRDYEACIKEHGLRPCAYNTSLEARHREVSIRSSLYAAFLPEWQRAYPDDQLLILRSEDYFTDRASILSKTVKFLGLDNYPEEIISHISHNNSSAIAHGAPRHEMLPETRRLLQRFLQPYMVMLEDMLHREMWDDGP